MKNVDVFAIYNVRTNFTKISIRDKKGNKLLSCEFIGQMNKGMIRETAKDMISVLIEKGVLNNDCQTSY